MDQCFFPKKQHNQQSAGGDDEHCCSNTSGFWQLCQCSEAFSNNEQNFIKAAINHGNNVCKNSRGFGASKACRVSNHNRKRQQSTGGNGHQL